MTPFDDWDRAANVLAVRLDAMGDVLMTGPALRALKESCAGRRLTLLTSPAGAEAAALLPGLDDVIVYSAPWMKAAPRRHSSGPDLDMIRLLHERRFDSAVIFTVYSQNPLPAVLLCYLADIPRRLAHCRENPYQLLTDWVAESEPERRRHEVRRQLDHVAHVGCKTADERLKLNVPSEARRWAQAFLQQTELDRTPRWVLMHPGASAPSRRYPPEHFAAAGRLLVKEHGCRVLVTGSTEERELVSKVHADIGRGSRMLAEACGLAKLAALIALAPVIVTNNTGPAHVAAALQTPVVDLYALTNPQHTPWRVPCRVLNHDVPCKYCYKSVCPEQHHDCLRRVPPHAVARAASELLGLRSSTDRRPLALVSEDRG